MSCIKKIMIVLIVLVAKFTSAQDFPYHYFSHINSLINNHSLAAVSSDIKTDVGVYNLWAGGFKPLTDYMISFSMSPGFQKRNRRTFYKTKVGIGAVVLKEKIGPFNQNILHLIYAYHIPLDRKTILSLGICGMVENMEIDVNSLSPLQTDDPRLLSGNNSSFLIDGGFGATLYGENYQFSFSALNLAPGVFHFKNSSAEDIRNYRKYFVAGKYNFEVSDVIDFQPEFTLRNSKLHSFNFDVSGTFGFTYFSCGGGYRSENSVFIFARIPFNDFNFTYTSENPLRSNHLIGNGHTFTVGWNINHSN